MATKARLQGFIGAAMTAALALGVAGCGGDGSSTGSLLVNWTIPIGCQSTNIVRVEARVSTQGAAPNVVDIESMPCSANTPFEFVTLPAGRFAVTVEGFDSQGVGTFLGEVADIKVPAASQKVTEPVVLTQKPSAIDATWVFENGKLCTANGVSTVRLAIFDDASVQHLSVELTQPFPCDPGGLLLDDQRSFGPTPEPLRPVEGVLLGGLVPKRTYFVHAIAYDAAGVAIMKGEQVVQTELGTVSEGVIVLVDCFSDATTSVSCQ